MIIKTEAFQKLATAVLTATDGSELSTLTETLELRAEGNILYMCVTNKEYYCAVKFQLDHEENFKAAVNANLFLKLIAAITTSDIELTVCDTYMNVKANGNYKIPLIFENEKMMEVPEIKIENKTIDMNISSDVLESILNYNSKQLAIGTMAKPVQKMFYLDQEGCITFTTGACVNSFALEKPIRVLLNSRLVELFKLFKGTLVRFSLGYDAISETIVQTKVSFENDNISLTAITGCDDSLLNQVPVEAIRSRASKSYPNTVVLNVKATLDAINRLLLFSAGYGGKENLKPYSTFEFDPESVTIFDTKKENTEILKYQNGTILSEPYTMTLDIVEFKKILDNCSEQFITLNFGDSKACVLTRNAIKNVLPEVVVK